jgi:4-diphosphocytidyl-2-C-methyl-D-erythritol kinase
MIVMQKDAHAKINLSLQITGFDRSSELHTIDGIFLKIPIKDTLQITCSNDDKISKTLLKTPKIECKIEFDNSLLHLPSSKIEGSNLAVKAAALFYKFIQQQQIHQNNTISTPTFATIRINIKKYIPVAAGMGGGSADAAAVLSALNTIHNNCLKKDQLIELALLLGTDVVFALSELTFAKVRGIGEKITPLTLPPHFYQLIVLVNTGDIVKTAKVYKQFDFLQSKKTETNIKSTNNYLKQKLFNKEGLVNSTNDLEEAACSLQPTIQAAKLMLKQQEGCQIARMSGSGNTCFGLFKNKESAKKAAKEINLTYPQWWVQHLCKNF